MGDAKEQNQAPSLLGWESWAFRIWTVDIFIRETVNKGDLPSSSTLTVC